MSFGFIRRLLAAACICGSAAVAAPVCPAPEAGGDEAQRAVFEKIRGTIEWPAQACTEGREGTVVAGFRAVDGAPFEVQIRKSSGDVRLDHAVMAALMRAKALPGSGQVTVVFRKR